MPAGADLATCCASFPCPSSSSSLSWPPAPRSPRPIRKPPTTSRPAATARPTREVRATACDNLLNADRLTGKDKSVALGFRGNTLVDKRDYDRAIEVLTSAIAADPDNVGVLNLRGVAYERKGQDDLAMADYNLAIQKRANYGVPYSNRGTIQLRRGALQSALDDFNLSIKYAPKFLLGWTNRDFYFVAGK